MIDFLLLFQASHSLNMKYTLIEFFFNNSLNDFLLLESRWELNLASLAVSWWFYIGSASLPATRSSEIQFTNEADFSGPIQINATNKASVVPTITPPRTSLIGKKLQLFIKFNRKILNVLPKIWCLYKSNLETQIANHHANSGHQNMKDTGDKVVKKKNNNVDLEAWPLGKL